jgi:Mlc titration factor MtfA (ptsG expression regulator)
MWSYQKWKQRRLLRRYQYPAAVWRNVLSRLPILNGLSEEELVRLRDLAVIFLHEKSIEATQGVTLSEETRLLIAVQACLPILNLDLSWYKGWVSVIIYPADFIPARKQVDEAGVVHNVQHALSGEAWLRGPVILSLSDVVESGVMDGRNLVIHEFAHKLDMLNGAANGFPPLHSDMDVKIWTRAFSEAYADLRAKFERGDAVEIHPYATTSPAEFFAVFSEVFFETPLVVKRSYPAVYRQFCAFYRQDPQQRFTRLNVN